MFFQSVMSRNIVFSLRVYMFYEKGWGEPNLFLWVCSFYLRLPDPWHLVENHFVETTFGQMRHLVDTTFRQLRHLVDYDNWSKFGRKLICTWKNKKCLLLRFSQLQYIFTPVSVLASLSRVLKALTCHFYATFWARLFLMKNYGTSISNN